MNQGLLLSILGFALISCIENGNSKSNANFSGSYKIIYNDNAAFSCKLNQSMDSIFGTYCGYNANHSDCGLESQGAPDCPIKGTIRNDTAFIEFKSCFMQDKGQAILIKSDEDILWITTKYPENKGRLYFCATPNNKLLKAVPDN